MEFSYIARVHRFNAWAADSYCCIWADGLYQYPDVPVAVGYLDYLSVVAVHDTRLVFYSNRSEGRRGYGKHRYSWDALDCFLALLGLCAYCFLYNRLLHGGYMAHTGSSVGYQKELYDPMAEAITL